MILVQNGRTKLEGRSTELLDDFSGVVEAFATSEEYHKAVKGGKRKLQSTMHDIIDLHFDNETEEDFGSDLPEELKEKLDYIVESLAEVLGLKKKED